MKRFSYFLLLLSLMGCTPSEKQSVKTEAKTSVEKQSTLFSEMHIIPLGKVDQQTLAIVRKGIEQFYGVRAVIEKVVPLTPDLLAKNRPGGDEVLYGVYEKSSRSLI